MPRVRQWRWPAAVALALTVACNGDDGTGPTTRYTADATDAVGDAIPGAGTIGADLVRVTITVENGNVTFRADFTAATYSAATTHVSFALDTDESLATGDDFLNGIGSDYLVNLGVTEGQGVVVLRWTPPNQYTQVANLGVLLTGQNRLEGTVPLVTFNDDGRMGIIATSYSSLSGGAYTGIQDYLPNDGQPPLRTR